ncbi:NucA/NucB deoxyribonuclease domain-containing protein [Streptomyces roseofulvus]|uniref:NucA/NucB deoxyribonuclease domain-containing protein n=1 Tax=Streptomyces TaxID=1883 RepID=UPI003D2F93E3
MSAAAGPGAAGGRVLPHEYPFGSTFEGPASPDYDYSIKYLDLSQNRSAGGSLAVFYARERILHRDGFLVRIGTF